MKTAVEAIFVGKARQYNRRFLQMCSHHLIEPVACTPAAGWEKGQVENQVGVAHERFFTPRLRFKATTTSTPGIGNRSEDMMPEVSRQGEEPNTLYFADDMRVRWRYEDSFSKTGKAIRRRVKGVGRLQSLPLA